LAENKSNLYILVELSYKGINYAFLDDHSNYKHPGSDDAHDFWWGQGNGSCDCNKSIFINRHCDSSFEEMPCGETIKLSSLTFIGDWSYSGWRHGKDAFVDEKVYKLTEQPYWD